MPMDREEHENLLNELLDGELDHTRRTEILQTLRTDYGSVIDEHQELSSTREKLQSEKDDLVVSNSKLFRELGTTNRDPETEKQAQEKEYSETVTIEELEGRK